MKKWSRVTCFILGVLVAVPLLSISAPAIAALTGKQITIYSGISVYMDDKKLTPKDANGNTVDVFSYNGTTYLPIRAISNELDIPVQWDGATSSVYLGKHTSNKPAVMLTDLDYFTGNEPKIAYDKMDNLGNSHSSVLRGDFDNTYLINGQYSAISGTLFRNYGERSYTKSLYDGTIRIYGDGALLYSATVTAGVEPIDFHVDISGVLTLRVEFEDGLCNSLADCGLWT